MTVAVRFVAAVDRTHPSNVYLQRRFDPPYNAKLTGGKRPTGIARVCRGDTPPKELVGGQQPPDTLRDNTRNFATSGEKAVLEGIAQTWFH